MAEADGTQPGVHVADLEDLRGAAHDRAVLAEARVVLARRLGVPPGEALQHLIWLARDLDIELSEAAALLVKDGGGGPVGAVPAGRRPPRAEGGTAERQALLSDAEDVLRRVTAEDTAGDAEILAALPDDPVAGAVLDGALDSAAHLVPVRGPDGNVVDFLYASLNSVARDMFGRGPEELTGRRLLQTDPGAALGGLFDEYVEVLESGRSLERSSFLHTTAQRGLSRSSRTSARCVHVPTGVCVTWRFHFAEDRVVRRLERVERLALIGFGEWDLATGEADWTPQMLANYGLAPDEVPPMPHDLPKVVADDDLPLVEEAVQTMFSRREPVEAEHRVIGQDGTARHLWVFAEPVLGESGLPISINIVSQDITRRRGVERALAETRRQMLRQQARTAQERRVAVTLRRAILPDEDEVEQLPGLVTGLRSLAAESTARIGGDWFATRTQQDGRGMFAIGDAAGHGLPAAAAMARTRNGLLGLACTGEAAGRLVGWLNELVGNMDPPATGTAIVAHFDPSRRVLEWTCAGHPPPILVRDGQAMPLEVVRDPMLGAMPGWEYTTIRTGLHSGDLLFLYTDGLVERRDADLDERIVRLTGILRESSTQPARVLDEVLARMEHDRAADDTTLFALYVE
ncbi:PP2C family protein-serine/threonine phosphatase [Actinomadura madurae]|uniref:PP2C family protein-serine/threonine phosphatase n=1 Tax=Actinomadura madurae TaxID=1993 RepID=UPI0020D26203|nr:SpoIIE family protein phosphatase [Actinomadura madurae]MCP9955785.1 SpoIIE family protein phosphatase [Actinomadura madurae]MCP9985018.1 SpoIIE family protein phosphatase [Actinomadura madurae]